MTGRSFWEPFVKDARALSNKRLNAWLDRWDPIILAQYARRGYRSTRPPDQPLSTGGLEAVIKPVQTALFPRRYGLKNRERLNRLLNLVQLELNGDADDRDYTRLIRAWLEENNGRPRIRRRAVTDPRGAPSLRALGAKSMTARARAGRRWARFGRYPTKCGAAARSRLTVMIRWSVVRRPLAFTIWKLTRSLTVP